MIATSSALAERIRHEYVTADRFIALCDHVYWQDTFGERAAASSFRGGQTVFCKIDRVWECLGRLVRTPRRVVLITGQGDYPIDDRRVRDASTNVHAWFGSNALAQNPRVHALPLGLGSQTCPVTLRATDIAEAREQDRPREGWLYVNFRPDTHPKVRQPIYDYFSNLKNEPWITFRPPTERGAEASHYLQDLTTHRFAVCPPGFGIDTHRMWEALYAGAIPIVLDSPALTAFKELPILFVKDYAEITSERLKTEEQRIRQGTWNWDALFLPYWRQKIQTAKAEIQTRPQLSLAEWSSTFLAALIRRFSK